jgi:hypothetical protein
VKIVIETIRHDRQRYPTLGDYWADPDGTWHIRVSEMGDPRYSLLIGLHEMVEFALCEQRGIAEPDIAAFDIAHPELDDPGASPQAPYHVEHMFAEGLERHFAEGLGVDWQQYETDCKAMFD